MRHIKASGAEFAIWYIFKCFGERWSPKNMRCAKVMGILIKKKDMCSLSSPLILFILGHAQKPRQKSKPGHCCDQAVTSKWCHMCLTRCFILLKDISRLAKAAGQTHLIKQMKKFYSLRQPSFSCQRWKQNRWEMKCWDWSDLVGDCCLNSWGWNWAFCALAPTQDTIWAKKAWHVTCQKHQSFHFPALPQ